MSRRTPTRRKYIAALVGGSTLGLAGCSESDNSAEPNGNNTSADQPQNQTNNGSDDQGDENEEPVAHWPFVHGTAGNANYVPDARGPLVDDSVSLGTFGTNISDSGIITTADPIIANNILYAAREGFIRGIDPNAGEIAHEASVGSEVHGFGYHQGTVIVTTFETVYGFDPSLGEPNWEVDVDTAITPPTARDGLAVVGGDNGMVGIAVDSGDVQWRNNIAAGGRVYRGDGTTDPIAIGENYAFPTRGKNGRNNIAAVDLETGEKASDLKSQLGAKDYAWFIYGVPVYRDGALYVFSGDGIGVETLTRVNTDGLTVDYNVSIDEDVSGACAVTDSQLIYGTGQRGDNKTLYRRELQTGELAGPGTNLGGSLQSTPKKTVANSDRVYVTTNESLAATDHSGTVERKIPERTSDWGDIVSRSPILGYEALIGRNAADFSTSTLEQLKIAK